MTSTISPLAPSDAHHCITKGDATVLLMRTTITLTPEAAALVQRAMDERSLTFKEVVNAAIVDALAPELAQERYVTPVFEMGRPLRDLDDVNAVLDDLFVEDYLAKERRSQ